MPARASARTRTSFAERTLWFVAIAAMLPWPLGSIGRLYYADAAGSVIPAKAAAEATATGAQAAAIVRDAPVRELAPAEPARWSASRLAAFARTVGVVPATPVATLLLPGRTTGIAVFDGATEAHMTLGAGRLRETSPVDGGGNIVLSAHRDGSFRALKDLVVGDRLRLRTGQGERVFRVAELRVVRPDAVHVLAPTAKPTLTLITCYPFYFAGSAPERFVVRAQLLASSAGGDAIRPEPIPETDG